MFQSLPPSLLGSTSLELQPELPSPRFPAPGRLCHCSPGVWCVAVLCLCSGAAPAPRCASCQWGWAGDTKDNVSAARSPPNTPQPDPTSGQICQTPQKQGLITAPTPAPAVPCLVCSCSEPKGCTHGSEVKELSCWGPLGSKSLKFLSQSPGAVTGGEGEACPLHTVHGRDGWEPPPPWLLSLLLPGCLPSVPRPQALTHQRFPCPVVFVVEHVTVPLEQVCEELPQVVVVGLLEEIQAPHVAQVRGHLLCGDRGLRGAQGTGTGGSGQGTALTWEVLTEHLHRGGSFGVTDLLVPLLQCVGLAGTRGSAQGPALPWAVTPCGISWAPFSR